MKHQAYGETKAPTQVDTLRDETCPVCGDSDSFDGDTCQVCGYVAPPKIFQDPDLQKARLLDLRADPATGDPSNTNPNVGQNLPPVDPEAVDDNGEVPGAGAEDQSGVVEGEVRTLDDGTAEDEPQADEEADEEAEGVVGGPEDPEAAQGHVNQGGEPFTPGPNAATPMDPIDPADVEAEDDEEAEETGEPVAADGQVEEGTPEEAGVPGTPADGTPDLLCPACGFQADASQPTSTPADPNAPAAVGDGMLEGDVCPNCGKATLMSVGQIEQMEQMQPPAAV